MAIQLRKGTAAASLSLTPLIDVVFLLLIFFVVTSRFEKEDYEVEITLPHASEAMPLTMELKEMWVNIDQNGMLFIDGKQMEGEEVEKAIVQAATNNPNQKVIIRADKRVVFDHVVAVMNSCNKAGIADYTVTTAGEG